MGSVIFQKSIKTEVPVFGCSVNKVTFSHTWAESVTKILESPPLGFAAYPWTFIFNLADNMQKMKEGQIVKYAMKSGSTKLFIYQDNSVDIRMADILELIKDLRKLKGKFDKIGHGLLCEELIALLSTIAKASR